MESIDWSQYAVVGFTVVFQQMVASLALARRIKEKVPDLPFEDDIASEIVKQCGWVDAIHCGDADLTIADLMRRLANNNLENLDLTPIPDFDEYFHVRKSSGYDDSPDAREVMIPFETAPQVLQHLKTLSRRYGVLHFNAIDNILAPEYVTGLFGKLAEEKTDLKLHYEIRPSMSHEQLRLMRLGGLISVQPGVESFSTHVLTLMKKLTTGMKNVELLKWTTYYGITNLYNVTAEV